MRYKLLLSLLFSLLFFLNSCGSNSHGDGFYLQEKKFLHNLFLTEYLWYDKVTSNVNYTNFTNPSNMVNSLRVNPPDIWSFSMTEDEYEDYINQKTSGFGFYYSKNLQIFLIRIGSPTYGKLFRGDTIIQIDGNEASAALISDMSKNLNKATIFTVIRHGNLINITVKPKEYTFKVSLGKIISHHSKKVGYLRYDSFSGSSVPEFEAEFSKFKNANIDELIIDLRYNGGGSITVASTLLDNITNAYSGQRQGYLDWNENYKEKNENLFFSDEAEPNDLNMKRVIFLVTKNSASASELVISALKPYLGDTNVITIGTNTHGKNVGMSGKAYGNNYYFIINFFVRNNINNRISFEGISPTCSAEDDITHLMGDKDETMLKTALHYIETNNCL